MSVQELYRVDRRLATWRDACKFSGLLFLLTGVAWMALAGALPAASAAPLTLGQAAPTGSPTLCASGAPTEVLLSSASGFNLSTMEVNPPTTVNPYVVPQAGLITSWTTNAGAGVGQTLKMVIFRPVPGSPNVYTVVAHDGPRSLTSSVLNTFPTGIPVRSGDVVGINDANAAAVPNVCFFRTTSVDDVLALAETDTPDGVSATVPSLALGARPNVSVTLQPAPTVTAVDPRSGWYMGGTQVTITGTDFEGASAVDFGGAPAAGYAVDSETEITAISPPGSAGATVDVNVVTSAGTSATVGGDKFNYTAHLTNTNGCVVPKLVGKSLKAVRKSINRAHCKLGKVRGSRDRDAKVKRQHPRVGMVLASDAKVSVTFDRRYHRRAEGKR